jgi:S1-C subfamily serine protease
VTSTVGGVLADERGKVRAFWASFSRGNGDSLESFMNGIPIARISDIVEPLRRGAPLEWRSLGVEWSAITLAQARDRGLSEAQARELEAAGGERRRMLAVARRRAASPAAEVLRDGDLLVAIDGKAVADFAAVERAAQQKEVKLRLVRDGALVEIPVATEVLDGNGTERAVIWAGALLQPQHPPIAMQRGLADAGVYVAFYFYGSPANRDGLGATRRIEALNGEPTPDLDAFLKAASAVGDRGAVRLRTRTLDGRVDVVTLKLDLEYWPTVELRRGPGGWERTVVSALSGGEARLRTSPRSDSVRAGLAGPDLEGR